MEAVDVRSSAARMKGPRHLRKGYVEAFGATQRQHPVVPVTLLDRKRERKGVAYGQTLKPFVKAGTDFRLAIRHVVILCA